MAHECMINDMNVWLEPGNSISKYCKCVGEFDFYNSLLQISDFKFCDKCNYTAINFTADGFYSKIARFVFENNKLDYISLHITCSNMDIIKIQTKDNKLKLQRPLNTNHMSDYNNIEYPEIYNVADLYSYLESLSYTLCMQCPTKEKYFASLPVLSVIQYILDNVDSNKKDEEIIIDI